MKILVDPPEGWKYGFPREVYSEDLNPFEIEEWFLKEGYPQELINQCMLKHCRWIKLTDEDQS